MAVRGMTGCRMMQEKIVLNGEAGDDYIEVYSGGNVIDGGSGDDTIYSIGGINTVTTGDGNDTISLGADWYLWHAKTPQDADSRVAEGRHRLCGGYRF